MLSRGLYDAVAIWPIVAWPIIFSSCFYAFLRLCQMMRQSYGLSPLGGKQWSDRAVAWGVLPVGIAVEVTVHAYMLYVVGYLYILIAIPIYILGWILLPTVLNNFRPGMAVLAVTHVTFFAAFGVLMGFAEVNVLRALNSDLYGLLMGVPAAL